MSDGFAAMLAAERLGRLSWGERLRRERELEASRPCPVCGERIDAHGRNPYSARYCSDACKMRAYRRRVTTGARLTNEA